MTPEQRRIELIDRTSDRGPLPLLSDEEAIELLRASRRIAIVGASSLPWRASHSVMRYLLDKGYDCEPVNPYRTHVLDRACYPSLEAAVAAGGPFDIVDVFRRPEFTPDVARSAVATGCGALWLQQGVISAEAVRIAHEGGLGVVMDRCTAVMHRHLRG
ncbi:MAG: CoA-binding protein [Candidatus Limnocylindrales bacterium]